jgi:hypothetical protein
MHVRDAQRASSTDSIGPLSWTLEANHWPLSNLNPLSSHHGCSILEAHGRYVALLRGAPRWWCERVFRCVLVPRIDPKQSELKNSVGASRGLGAHARWFKSSQCPAWHPILSLNAPLQGLELAAASSCGGSKMHRDDLEPPSRDMSRFHSISQDRETHRLVAQGFNP